MDNLNISRNPNVEYDVEQKIFQHLQPDEFGFVDKHTMAITKGDIDYFTMQLKDNPDWLKTVHIYYKLNEHEMYAVPKHTH